MFKLMSPLSYYYFLIKITSLIFKFQITHRPTPNLVLNDLQVLREAKLI